MKPTLLFFLFFLFQFASAQSLDYISVRKRNGRVVKNFYAGSEMLVQLNDGSYLKGPVKTMQNDSVYITLYDVRYYPTPWGSFVRDTVAISVAGFQSKDIARVFLNRRRGFFQRNAGPLLMIGGAGYFSLNLLNGDLFNRSISRRKRQQKAFYSAGAFGLGYLLNKLFASDGFSKSGDRIVYVDL